MGKKGKKDILPTILLEKKILDDQKSPKPKPTPSPAPPPSLQELNGRPLNRDDNENGFKTNSKKQIARAAHFF